MRQAILLPTLATDIYLDQAAIYGKDLIRNLPQFKAIIGGVAANGFDPLPDPAALVVAARLLHDLVTIRLRIPLNTGTAWVLVETYLLMHGLGVAASDHEVGSLVVALHQQRMDTASTLHELREIVETESLLE